MDQGRGARTPEAATRGRGGAPAAERTPGAGSTFAPTPPAEWRATDGTTRCGRRASRCPTQGVRTVTFRMRSSFGYLASRNAFASAYTRFVFAFAMGRSP